MQMLSDKQLQKIVDLIQKHVGKSNPIQADELSESVGLSDREIRRAIQILVNDEGYAIGSTTKGPYGFFIISDNADFQEAIKNLSSREQKIAERIKKLIDNAQSEGVKVKNYKKKIIDKSTTINIKNLILINLQDE